MSTSPHVEMRTTHPTFEKPVPLSQIIGARRDMVGERLRLAMWSLAAWCAASAATPGDGCSELVWRYLATASDPNMHKQTPVCFRQQFSQVNSCHHELTAWSKFLRLYECVVRRWPPAGDGVSLCWYVAHLSLESFNINSSTSDCGAKNEIKSREPIRCRECGHRIMYKKRTKRSTWLRYDHRRTPLTCNSGSIRSAVTRGPVFTATALYG